MKSEVWSSEHKMFLSIKIRFIVMLFYCQHIVVYPPTNESFAYDLSFMDASVN